MTVFLVGAGPGDPGLLTVRARELLGRADVLLSDQLVPAEAWAMVPPTCEVVDVGKVGGGKQVPQEETTARLVQEGLRRPDGVVVRLKGGDPFVFGRGGEEAQALRAAGVAYEVVPGVTAGIAAPAFAGIPVTQRGVAPGVAFVTGHEDPKKPETQLDWPALAAFPGTLVFYMGVRALPRIAERLVAGGRPADEPAAVVQSGTLPGQRAVVGTLSTLPGLAAEAGIKAPAITVVGGVAALGDELAWLGAARPLHGVSVAVTRARAQASVLAQRLRALGAEVVEAPTIRTEAVAFDVPSFAEADVCVFTSPSGVEHLFGGVRDARALAGPTVLAIGPGTADALRARGIEPDVVPSRSSSEGVIDALASVDVRRAIVVRAVEGREVLVDWLRDERGAEVELVTPYATHPAPLDDALRDAALACDYALFASGSSVRSLHAAAGGTLAGPRVVSIGPATSAVLRELGVEPVAEAAVHTPDGLVEALLAVAASAS